MRLSLVSQGAVLSTRTLTDDDQTVEATLPVPRGSCYVRAEVRGETRPDTTDPQAGELDMEAFTNPVFLIEGAPPAGYVGETAAVPDRSGPRRKTTSRPPRQ